MKKNLVIPFLFLVVTFSMSSAQRSAQVPLGIEPEVGTLEFAERNYFISSTMFVPYALFLEPSPAYYQLNFGYRIDSKNAISIEAITWKYLAPLGIPYGPDYENEEAEFPGAVQSFGVGLAYQRFLWRGIYGQIHSTAFHQNFLQDDDEKIQSGFQLFNTFRVGYHIKLFNKRFFLEPSVAATWWPINTNLPSSFQVEEDKWNKYFLFEPGLHFGVNF